MNERVKQLRTSLGLTLGRFAAPLGVRGSAIANIEAGARRVTSQMAAAICHTYNVREEWLREGTGEMYEEKPLSLDEWARQVGATDTERRLMGIYLDLPQDVRREVVTRLEGLFAEDRKED